MPKYLINLFSSGLTFSTTGRLYATGRVIIEHFSALLKSLHVISLVTFFFYPFLPGSLLLPTYVFGLFAFPPPDIFIASYIPC